ncbi:Uma2 family endonuclease [Mumia sp. DW29H23]|uniref:Uma2 family endonuclease n=1 Tax=Mumia sp. DW29H23 TaxID=3421241 RepID=UPI003D68BA38
MGQHRGVSMSWEEYLAGDETLVEYYDDTGWTRRGWTVRHQRVVQAIAGSLEDSVPARYFVAMQAGWRPGRLELCPDVLVAEQPAPDDYLRDAPNLVVEVVDGDRAAVEIDKPRLYRAYEVPWLLVVDPTVDRGWLCLSAAAPDGYCSILESDLTTAVEIPLPWRPMMLDVSRYIT